MRYEYLIGFRYLRAKRRESFISWITVISTLGLVIGVMTLNIVLAVFTGFEEELRDRILSFNPHLIVLSFSGSIAEPQKIVERAKADPQVVAAAPFVFGQVMLSAQDKVVGAVVRATGPGSEHIIDLDRFMVVGRLRDLDGDHAVHLGGSDGATIQLPGLILGKDVAKKLGLTVGAAVNVLSPSATSTAVGMVPRMKRFAVVGVFDSGMVEYDSSLVYMSLSTAQEFFDLKDRVTGVEVRIKDMFQAAEAGRRLAQELQFPYRVRDWIDLNRNLFAAMSLGKTVYFIVLLLIVLVAAFNIVSALIMVVMEKRKDIAILKSMGATAKSIRRIFVAKGMIIGGAGTAAGSLGALVICVLLKRFHFFELQRDVYGIDTLQVRIYPEYFVTVAVAALLICWLATRYPARQAARLTPVDVIRYE